MIQFDDGEHFPIARIQLEIEAIKHTFQKTTEENPNSFKPFAVFFKDRDTKSFICSCREILDEEDYYVAISEMLFAYSAIEAHAVLLAIEISKTINQIKYDVLEVYMGFDDYCVIYTMPYTLENNSVVWNDMLSDSFTIEKMEKAFDTSSNMESSIQIIESLYLHSHQDRSSFQLYQLISFFNSAGFETRILDEKLNKQLSII